MNCAKCGSGATKVVDSRSEVDNIRRRRECVECGFRFTTVEVDRDMLVNLMQVNGLVGGDEDAED